MEDSYFVKITGRETISSELEKVKVLMQRLRRVKMEVEGVKREKETRRKDLINQINEMAKAVDELQLIMPTKAAQEAALPVKKDVTKKAVPRRIVETVDEPMAEVMQPKTEREEPKRVDLSKLKGELEKLKRELEG